MDIIGALSVAKQVVDLSKDLRNIDSKVNDAEFKIRISELADHILTLRGALMDAQEREYALQKEIATLKDRALLRATLRDTNGLLYEINAAGENIGEPYCNLCFVREDKQIRLRHHDAKQGVYAHYKCDNCKTMIITGPPLTMSMPIATSGSWMK